VAGPSVLWLHAMLEDKSVANSKVVIFCFDMLHSAF
jgi:hypothetical protein